MFESVAASGYKTIDATPLGYGIKYAGTLVERTREDDFLPHVTNGSIAEPLTRCAQIITFNKPPVVGPWRTYNKNQHLISDQPTSSRACLTICNQAYKAIKIDKEDIRKACEYWEEFERGFLNDVAYNLSELWHTDALTGMMLHVSSRNAGANAGFNGNINLGTVAAPSHLTPDNIISFFTRMVSVLKDAKRWYDGQMFMIVPPAMSVLLLETMFAKQMCCNIGESVLFKGLVSRDILGFKIIESDRLRPTIDPGTNRLVYPILAGWKEAYAFTGDIVEAELATEAKSFGVYYKMLSVYGGGVLYPEALAKSYVTFSTNGVVTP